ETPATSPTDADTTDGGSRRQGNEPFTVIDPTDPDLIVAGWNDYCLSDLGAGWQGFAYSTDRGETWTDSMVPGYPQDTSEEGMESPLFGNHTDAGDPIAAFDNDGNLFVGGISFNRVGAINGDVYVATYLTTPHPSGYPVDYARTRIVGRGTPSRNFQGIFQDKPMLEVDRTGGDHDGNVYVCWSRFTGFGQNRILFSRSTDSGVTFSKPFSITNPGLASVQGCDIAIEGDGDVYLTFRTFGDSSARRANGVGFARSTDGGVSFSNAELIRAITPYAPADPFRDCGDGPFECATGFVFHRVPLEPRSTADQMSEENGVFLTYNAIRPDSTEASNSSYSSAGAGQVGQSLVYVVASWDDGDTWDDPVAVDEADAGHQFFPDIDALDGTLAVVWQDNRTDLDYDVQFPIGNTLDEDGNAISSGGSLSDFDDDIVNSFIATSSTDALGFADSVKVSDVGHQSAYEMFGNRDIPFHGDYNWIALALDEEGVLFGYASWTDNRNVEPGTDPRELEAQDGFDDGFDVLQCRDDLGDSVEGLLDPDIPLARRDAPFGGDTCGNGGGLDQDIFGVSFTP
ncbi:MAG TPA: sialidase family protein, partial [Actinomycetota bacterium]|nr:sialidase family protein [Actinomycetota bacterium]